MDAKQPTKNESVKQFFPPVVAVLGHVDHGKTSLLDAIRKTSRAIREYGGITQSIGASSIETTYENKKRRITFIDTPGHEAFSNMRSHGATAADIGLLVVSSVDGIKPQTKESIQLLVTAQIPIIAVLTMSDLPTKNPDRVKQELIRENVLLEGFGGDVPVIEVSAKANHNIKELLDLILLVAELKGISEKARQDGDLEAIVIESKRDPRAGTKATVIVKNGTIALKDEVSCEGQIFRVRMLLDELQKPVTKASVGEGVEILGSSEILPVGGVVRPKTFEAKPIDKPEPISLENFVYHKVKDSEGLSLILTADTQGSLEAIVQALPKGVSLVSARAGEISEADILQAKAVGAIALSFNTKIRSEVERLAFAEKVLVKSYKIIYEMLDELSEVLEGKRQMNLETILGKGKILASFPYEKRIAYGVSLLEGRLAKNDKIRIMRKDQAIGETTIQSLRVGKNPMPKVMKGEAGLVLAQDLDITIGDMIISFA